MERRLIVLRHAKSSWSSRAATDHERPLNKRGRRDAPRIGAQLASLGWTPDRVLSSDAQRTRETWARMASCFEPEPEVSFHRGLYLAGPAAVEEVVGAVGPEVRTVMVVGHNHGWEEVVEWLCGDDERMTTCNAALLSVEGGADWEEALALAPSWKLHQVVRPKDLSA